MKKLYFLVIVIFAVVSVKGQVINFPDGTFKSKLVYYTDIAKNLEGVYFKVDANNNGQIEVSEALQVSELDLTQGVGYFIGNFAGLEYFTNLKTFKTVSPSLSTFDISALTNLTTLSFTNSNLTNLIFDTSTSLLEDLDITQNLFQSLDVSGMEYLRILKCGKNSLLSLNISGCINLTTLECSENELTVLNLTDCINLANLNCAKNNLTALDVTPNINIEELLCEENQIGSLDVSMLENLKSLQCHTNGMTVLNMDGLENIEKLNCSTNVLSSINVGGLVHLKKLECFDNQLSEISVGELIDLEILNCNNNLITALDVEGKTKLKNLKFSNCPISTITLTGLDTIMQIECNNTALGEIDISGLTTLLALTCTNSNISTLNLSGATSLIGLYCSNNQIESLNLNGLSHLKYFNCDHNLLTSLNLTGLTNISSLICTENLFTTLDLTDLHKLNTLWINYNPFLESVFMKNGAPYNISTSGSVVLYGCTNLQYICADENKIAGLTQKVAELENNCVVNSYCSFTPGGTFYTINGNNTFDSNNNGCDASDENLPNLKFNITNGAQTGSIIPNQTGEYSIPVQAGTHTITPVFENPSYYTISTTAVNVTFPATTSPFTQNFCITPNGIHPDLEVAILPTAPARPGFNAKYKIILKNKGNVPQSGSVLLAYNDAVLDYISANPAFTTQSEGSLSWAFADLQPFETREINVTLNVNSPMETPAVNGDDVLTYTATITSEATDELPLDNTFTLPQIVVNSFDPNDKTCLEGTAISPDMIGQYVHYMIRFENTGTFAAENIVVKDMIDTEKFDVSSLVALNGSHPYVTRIEGNKVEFIFEGINLPFDDANNDGYVVFKVKTLPTLVLGNSFSNTASIYFDYNHPIVTEPAVTTFADLNTKDFEFNNYFRIYPNPSSGILNITTKQAIEMQSINIYNVLGQMVVAVPNAKGISAVDVSSLSTGNYFIKIVSDKGISNAKFVKN